MVNLITVVLANEAITKFHKKYPKAQLFQAAVVVVLCGIFVVGSLLAENYIAVFVFSTLLIFPITVVGRVIKRWNKE